MQRTLPFVQLKSEDFYVYSRSLRFQLGNLFNKPAS